MQAQDIISKAELIARYTDEQNVVKCFYCTRENKCLALNSSHINPNYGSCCINGNETLPQIEWECWKKQRRPHTTASQQCSYLNWDSTTRLYNKQFSFDRYLSWWKDIPIAVRTQTLSQQYGYSKVSLYLPSCPRCHIFLSLKVKSSPWHHWDC